MRVGRARGRLWHAGRQAARAGRLAGGCGRLEGRVGGMPAQHLAHSNSTVVHHTVVTVHRCLDDFMVTLVSVRARG